MTLKSRAEVLSVLDVYSALAQGNPATPHRNLDYRPGAQTPPAPVKDAEAKAK